VAASDEVLEDALSEGGPVRRGDHPRQRARVCGTHGCAAVLSRYNDSATCWLHGPGSDPMLRQR
jgi:hypothetical protein